MWKENGIEMKTYGSGKANKQASQLVLGIKPIEGTKCFNLLDWRWPNLECQCISVALEEWPGVWTATKVLFAWT